MLLFVCLVFGSGCLNNSTNSDVSISTLDGINTRSNEVVIYVAHDQDYSEPILKLFEQKTGINVKPLYDTETTKTVGLVNKLIAEKNNPQADVFWNNEVSRTIKLKNADVLTPYISPNADDKPSKFKDSDGYWTGFAARARVIIYNTDLVDPENIPQSIHDFKRPKWKGKFCIANPIFGTTGSHVSSLFALWGEEKAKQFFLDLKANDMKVVESNGMVRDQVVAGEYLAGLTDTDDAYDAISEGKKVAMIFPDEDDIGTLVIPNSVMMIKGGPNTENGRKLVDYLLSKEVESNLAESKAMQMPLGAGVSKPDHVPAVEDLTSMDITPYQISDSLESSQRFVQETLLI